jgi:hypothetical protein
MSTMGSSQSLGLEQIGRSEPTQRSKNHSALSQMVGADWVPRRPQNHKYISSESMRGQVNSGDKGSPIFPKHWNNHAHRNDGLAQSREDRLAGKIYTELITRDSP